MLLLLGARSETDAVWMTNKRMMTMQGWKYVCMWGIGIEKESGREEVETEEKGR